MDAIDWTGSLLLVGFRSKTATEFRTYEVIEDRGVYGVYMQYLNRLEENACKDTKQQAFSSLVGTGAELCSTSSERNGCSVEFGFALEHLGKSPSCLPEGEKKHKSES